MIEKAMVLLAFLNRPDIENELIKAITSGISNLINNVGPERYIETFLGYSKHKGYLPLTEKRINLSFDCDLEGDIHALPTLLELLDTYDFTASFACIGKLIERYPTSHHSIIDHGHEILNHTHTHPDHRIFNPDHSFQTLSNESKKREILLCHETCRELLDYEPIGFRTPHLGGTYTKTMYPILDDLGYRYSSSIVATRTPYFGAPFLEGRIIEFPLTPSLDNVFQYLHTWYLYRSPRSTYTEEHFCTLLKKAINVGIELGVYINFYFDPIDVVKMRCFEEILDIINDEYNGNDFTYSRLLNDLIRCDSHNPRSEEVKVKC